MTRSPSDWLPAVALLVALAGVTGSSAGDIRGIYRPSEYGFTGPRGCVLPGNLPRFDAIALHADTPGHAESLATRLGFVPLRSGDRHWRVSVPLAGGGAGLVWRDGRHDRDFDSRGILAPLPLQTLTFSPPDPELPLGWGRLTETTVTPQPNGVASIAYMIGLVRRIDITADHWPPEHTAEAGGRVPLLDFRSTYRIPALGARASDAAAGGWTGWVRLLEPYGLAGFTSGWMERRGAGWIGFGLLCPDLARATAWFDAHDVHYSRDGVAGRTTLRLDPAETDGWLIEVVGPPETPTP